MNHYEGSYEKNEQKFANLNVPDTIAPGNTLYIYIYYIMYYNLHVPTPPILPLILESAHSCGWGTCLFKNMRKDFCSILDSWMIQPKPAKSEKGTRCY